MKLKAVRGEIVPAAFAEYKISQGTRRHLEKDQDDDDDRRASTGDDDDAMTRCS